MWWKIILGLVGLVIVGLVALVIKLAVTEAKEKRRVI